MKIKVYYLTNEIYQHLPVDENKESMVVPYKDHTFMIQYPKGSLKELALTEDNKDTIEDCCNILNHYVDDITFTLDVDDDLNIDVVLEKICCYIENISFKRI